ncbi:MAG TPA: glycosyltransferase [Ignavibacteriaceae bacterium]|jgi:glycosyltransferase involved in cell wall biosynthesis|nr:glycosyltransferase [Ignavibacterium sp.]HOJ19880.1 glycosyltransferase [Ignavibacteriaceae bacterium]
MSLNKIKVLMIDSWVGEGNEYALYICKELKKTGLDISLIVPEDNRDKGTYDFPFLPLCPTKAKDVNKIDKTFRYFKYLLNIIKLIRKEKYDVVHFQFFRRRRIESLFFVLLKLWGINLAYTVHDISPLDESKLDHLFNLIVYKISDILFVHSNSNKKTLAQQTKLNEEKIKVMPHGDFDNYIPDKILTKSEARNIFGLSQQQNVILFFGAIKEYKGLDILSNSITLASKKIKNLALIIAGEAGDEETRNIVIKCKEILSQLSKEVQVVFHDKFIPVAEVANYFIASDVVVLPYRRVTHSGIPHLAFTFGRPIITSNVGDFEEIIDEGRSGFVLPSNTPENLSEKIIQIFSDESKLEEMRNYVKNICAKKYTWKDSAESLIPVYEKMTKHR